MQFLIHLASSCQQIITDNQQYIQIISFLEPVKIKVWRKNQNSPSPNFVSMKLTIKIRIGLCLNFPQPMDII